MLAFVDTAPPPANVLEVQTDRMGYPCRVTKTRLVKLQRPEDGPCEEAADEEASEDEVSEAEASNIIGLRTRRVRRRRCLRTRAL